MKTRTCLFASLLFICASSIVEAKEEGGWLRQRIKARVMKRIEDAPAPTASNDLNSKIEKPGLYTFALDIAGARRYYRLQVPKGYTSNSAPLPLVVSLHGGGGDMTVQSNDGFYKFISTSDREKFLVAFPSGLSNYKSAKLGTWNAGKCCAYARDQKSDDVAFIRQVVTTIQKQVSVDSTKIFATGMSNGAMMSYRLACEASDLFRAIAPVAGTDNTVECKPDRAVSILHIHSKKDEHVLFDGGRGPEAVAEEFITDFASVPATITKWAASNGCKTPAKKTTLGKNAWCEIYSGCRDKTEIRLCVTEDGGHSWPGGKKPLSRGSSPSKAIDATPYIWEFFKSHSG